MEYLYLISIIIASMIIYSFYNERHQNKKLRKLLKEEWMIAPKQEYTMDKLNSIREFYNAIQDDHLDIDDITWNDLDMDRIFMLLNNTQSSVGEEFLYATLRKPQYSAKELEEKNRLITFFQENEQIRTDLQLSFRRIGKVHQISIFEYINRLGEQKQKGNLPHYLMIAGFFISLFLLFKIPAIGGFAVVLSILTNIVTYYKRKAEIENFFTVFSYLLRLFNYCDKICRFDVKELNTYFESLRKDLNVFKNLRKGASIVVSSKVSGSIVDAIFDYMRMLFHFDLIKYNGMVKTFMNHRDILNNIYITIGLMETCIATASFRDKIWYYSIPELTNEGTPHISVEGLFHPLIENPVVNSIDEDQSVLITGSNASGKSTFIKTLAVNSLLSQTIYTSLSKGYRANYFMIYSSMALRDSLCSNESYYIVEIKSLKRILDRMNPDIPILCFIDEVLRGTNTLERIAASSRILMNLADRNTLCFAATHDIELTHILENYFSNYHFQERIEENDILFDYKLYKGRTMSRNAIKLLGLLGYSQEIIKTAEHAAEEFTQIGEWTRID